MDRWLAILIFLNVPCGVAVALWFRRDQYYKTPQAEAAMNLLSRWLRLRVSTPLHKDLCVIRRCAGIISLVLFGLIAAWPHVAPADTRLPSLVLNALMSSTFVWASLNAWIERERLFRDVAKFIFLPPLMPWAMLALNRITLNRWSVAPFDSLIQHGPLASILAADNVWLATTKISALYLPVSLILALTAIILFSLVPLTYLALIQPPIWIIRGWMAMTATQKHNTMLVLYTASILMTAAIGLIKVFGS